MNTPSGANMSTHSTSRIIVAASSSISVTKVRWPPSPPRVIARPNSSAKIARENIYPAAAAAMGLVGMIASS
jgi:hypothetical protein